MPLTPTIIKEFHGQLTQTGTNNPSCTILHNTIGTITWTRLGNGQYEGTSAGLFTAGKTSTIMGNNSSFIFATSPNSNTIQIQTYDQGGTNADNFLTNTPIEIKVYY